MSALDNKYGQPILEYAEDPFTTRHIISSNFIYSLFPRLRAERTATFEESMMMTDILLKQYESAYLANQNDKTILCMPHLFSEPKQGVKIRNKSTQEVYEVIDTIKNPTTGLWEGLLRIEAITPPSAELAEKLEFLDETNLVRFTAEFTKALGTEAQNEEGLQKDVGPIMPTVVYALIKKEPASIGGQPFGPRKQHKPRHMETLRSVNTPGHSLSISSLWFDTLVQMDCYTTDNRSADLLASWFEDFMRQYTWVLKYNGVQEILFWQRLRDKAVTKWRQDLISRTVQYFFRIEELLPAVGRDLYNIDINIDLAAKIRDEGTRWIAGQFLTGHISTTEYDALFRGASGEYLFGDLFVNDGNLT